MGRIRQVFRKVLVVWLSFGMLLTGGLLPEQTVKAEPGQLLFSDDFADGNADGWTIVQGNPASFSVNGSNEYAISYGSGSDYEKVAVAGSAEWNDYSVEVRIKLLSDGAAGVIARYTDANNFYHLRINSKNDKVELYRKTGGTMVLLSDAAMSLQTGTVYSVRLTVNGPAISGYVNGGQKISVTDFTLSGGKAGTRGYGTDYLLDDVLVTAPEPDLIPPEIPADLTAVAGSSSIGLSWTPAADNIETVGYSVYRNDAFLATVVETAFIDRNLSPGIYSYRVTAHDAAGNTSQLSLPASATVVAGEEEDWPVLFADDFEDGDAAGWSGSGYSVAADGGTLVYKHTYTSGSTTRYATAGSSTWTSYSMEARLKNSNDNNSTGLYARMKDSDNSYVIKLDLKNDMVRLNKMVNGVSTALDSAPLVLNTNTAYTIRLDLDGPILTGFVDGVELLNAVDATFTSGKIGLGGYSKHSYSIDDVLVRDLRRPMRMMAGPQNAVLLEGESRQFSATVYDQGDAVMSGLTLDWTSDDPGITVVDANGLVTGVAQGSTVIRAGYGDLAASAAVTVKELVPEPPLSVSKVLSPIAVDGILDEDVWSTNRGAGKLVAGVSDNSAVFGTLWDDQYLYVGVLVQDGQLFNDSTDSFDDDSVEIFIDADHNHGTSYDLNDWHFRKGYLDADLYERLKETTGVKHGSSAVPGGYAVEMAIPWKNLGLSAAPGLSVGFDIAVNDDDNGAGREGQIVWAGIADNYKNTFGFGDLILSSATVGIAVPPPDPVVSHRYVTPLGAGAMDGTSWDNAFPGDQIGGLQAAWEATSAVSTLYVGSGTYTVPQTLHMESGGLDALHMKKLAGVDTGGGLPVFTGPYTLANQAAGSLIDVAVGVSYWTVQDIVIRNYFTGIYANGQHEGIRILNVSVHDMSDGIYLWGRATRSNPAAGSHDIIIKDGEYTNYTKSAVRFRNGNYMASVINVMADAGGQANWRSGNFPMGFRIGNSPEESYFFEHDIVFQDVVSRNSWHQDGSNYWNGDGFTAERQAYNITYIRSKAFDSTDGGWDDKSVDPVLIDTVSMGNKRNYRFWNNPTFIGVVAGYSCKRGGSGDSPGLWVGSGTGRADIYYSTFYNNQDSEISLESAVNQVNIYDSIIGKSEGTYLYSLNGGQLTATNTEEFIQGLQGTDPQLVNGANGDWEGGSEDFNSLLYGSTKGYYYPGPYAAPYTIELSTPSLLLGLYTEQAVSAQVYDQNHNPVADPEKVVWYSDDGYTSRLLQSRGANAVVQGVNAGVTEIVAVYKGAEARILVTVAE